MRRISRACVLDRTPSQEWVEHDEWQTESQRPHTMMVESEDNRPILFFYEKGLLFAIHKKGELGFKS